jgi:hypothetical protein
MLFARETAKNLNLPLVVVFNLVPEFLGATLRQVHISVAFSVNRD